MNRRRFVTSLLASSSALYALPALARESDNRTHIDDIDGSDTDGAESGQDKNRKKTEKKKSAHLLFPDALKKGSVVGIVAPASGVSPDEVKSGVKSLEALGCTVVLGKSIYRGSAGFLAAPDDVRAAEFMEFINRKDIDAIVCARGGYGVMRILPMLDFEAIRQSGKIIMGYSDITALLNAIFIKSNMVSFHGPVASGEFDDFTRDSVVKTLFAPETSSEAPPELTDNNGQHKTKEKKAMAKKLSAKHDKHNKFPNTTIIAAQAATDPIVYTDPALTVIGAGKAQGRLVGGNLTIVCATLGTPYEIQTQDKILFLEDVSEEPYRIDRMLTHLWLASKLQQCAAIVLGKFSKSDPSNEYVPSYNLDEVLRSRLEPLKIPVVNGFSFGHIKSKLTLPVGALAELDADNKKLSILEKPVVIS